MRGWQRVREDDREWGACGRVDSYRRSRGGDAAAISSSGCATGGVVRYPGVGMSRNSPGELPRAMRQSARARWAGMLRCPESHSAQSPVGYPEYPVARRRTGDRGKGSAFDPAPPDRRASSRWASIFGCRVKRPDSVGISWRVELDLAFFELLRHPEARSSKFAVPSTPPQASSTRVKLWSSSPNHTRARSRREYPQQNPA